MVKAATIKNYCKVENEKFFKKGNIIMYYARLG